MSLPTHPEPDPHADPLVASVLRAADGAAAGACPDAELLAMYAERDLGGAEQAEVESHVHTCARCQAMVAALVRAMPEPAAAAAAEAERTSGGGFAAWFAGWRWLVPAASLTAVAVVAVWVGRGPADQAAESNRVANRAAAEREVLARELAAPTGKAAAESQDRLTLSRVEPAAPAAPAAAALGFEARAGREPAAKAEAPARATEARPPAPVATPAERAAETPAKAAAAADVRTETSALVGSAVREDAPAAGAGARPMAAERRAENESARQRESAAAAIAPPPPPPPAVVAPAAPTAAAPVFRANLTAASWRVRQGVVERTRDGAWERVTVPTGVTVIAVAAVSVDVCWAITADAVFIVTDGVTWTRTARPPAGPLTEVSATSARAATVTAGGTRFATTDGGATWAPVR